MAAPSKAKLARGIAPTLWRVSTAAVIACACSLALEYGLFVSIEPNQDSFSWGLMLFVMGFVAGGLFGWGALAVFRIPSALGIAISAMALTMVDNASVFPNIGSTFASISYTLVSYVVAYLIGFTIWRFVPGKQPWLRWTICVAVTFVVVVLSHMLLNAIGSTQAGPGA